MRSPPTTLSSRNARSDRAGQGEERGDRREQVAGHLAEDGHQPARLRTAARTPSKRRAPSLACLRRSSTSSTRASAHAALLQRHQQVEQQVGRLLGQALVALALGRQHDLGRFLADLLQGVVEPLARAASPCTSPPARSRARSRDHALQLVEHAGGRRRRRRRSRCACRCGRPAPPARRPGAACRGRSPRAPRARAAGCPEVSPFRQSALPAAAPEVREPGLARCARSASALAYATISTSPLARSCTTTGTSPSASNAISPGIPCTRSLRPEARPLCLCASVASFAVAWPHLDAHSRRRASRRDPTSPKWKIEAARAALARALGQHLGHVLDGAAAAGGDHRHVHRVRHRAGERQVEAVLRAVAVHAGEQDLARAARRRPRAPRPPRRGPVGVRPPCT